MGYWRGTPGKPGSFYVDAEPWEVEAQAMAIWEMLKAGGAVREVEIGRRFKTPIILGAKDDRDVK